MRHVIHWFEIPVSNFDRAKQLYSTILNEAITEENIGGYRMGIFPSAMEEGVVSGALVQGSDYEPSAKGSRVYLNGGSDLNSILMRVSEAGGHIQQPKTLITEEIGYCASFLDTEGNLISLHSGQ